jgi:signal transduction histidine kinase
MDHARKIWIMTIRRFLEVAWVRHAPTRYASVLVAPVLVAVAVPGYWWVACAVGALLGMGGDFWARRAFQRLSLHLDQLDDRQLRAAIGRHVGAIATMTAFYVGPYLALAFAPGPGPLIGLLFSAGGALVCACLHVMTPRMIFFTAPVPALGMIVNAYTLGDGGVAGLGALVAAMVAANAIIMARAGANTFRDLIVARLEAEEAASELERRVAERTSELAVATRRARAASHAKSMFLANMSHELRTPLNAVIGYAEMVEEDLTGGNTSQSVADLGRIRSSANHLLAMINEVLDFSRIEAGKLQLRPTEFDLRSLLNAALDSVRPTASKNRTTCHINIAANLGAVWLDETRLRQCVLNLLSNAAKFTRGGVIALDARACRVGGAEGVAISVRDTGPGIAANQLSRLFQPFVQADATHTRQHDGAGLGLVITRRLARAMGGDVQASSVLGQGSTFTLYLPRNMNIARGAAA